MSMIEYDQVVYSRGTIFGVEDEITLWVVALNVALGQRTKNALWELLDTSKFHEVAFLY